MLTHYVQLSSSIQARLFGSMRALLYAYLVGLEALDLFLSEPPLHAQSLCALGHNNGSDVCSSSKCPGETVHLPRLVRVAIFA